jgi:hypothetical protein
MNRTLPQLYVQKEHLAFVSELYSEGEWTSCFRHKGSITTTVKTLTMKEFETAIALACNSIESLKSSVKSIEVKDIVDAEVIKQTALFKEQQKQFEQQISLLHKTADTEKETILNKYTHEIRILSNQVEALKENTARSEMINKEQKEHEVICVKRDAETERELLSKRFASELSSMTLQLDSLRSQLAIADSAQLNLKEQVAAMKAECEASFNDKLGAITSAAAAAHSAEISRIQAVNSELLSELKQSAGERVAQCDQQHKEAIANLKLAYAELAQQRPQGAGSFDKGKKGEQDFDELVLEYTNWGELVNTAGIPHSADRSGKIKGCDTLFEIKNYSNDVPGKEVAKFLSDLAEHHDCPLGIFVSMNSRISGKSNSNFIQTSWTDKSQLLVFVSCFREHSITDIFGFMEACADIALTIYKLQDKLDDPQSEELAIKIEQLKHLVEKEIKRCSALMTTLNNHKRFVTETTNKHHFEVSGEIRNICDNLKCMIEIIAGTSSTDESPEEMVAVPAESVPKKKRTSKAKAPSV